jgi:hypothetical protein
VGAIGGKFLGVARIAGGGVGDDVAVMQSRGGFAQNAAGDFGVGQAEEDAVATGEDVGGAGGGRAAEFDGGGRGRASAMSQPMTENFAAMRRSAMALPMRPRPIKPMGRLRRMGLSMATGYFLAGILYSPTRELRYFSRLV